MIPMVFQIPSNIIKYNPSIIIVPNTVKKKVVIKYDMFTKVSNPIKCYNCG